MKDFENHLNSFEKKNLKKECILIDTEAKKMSVWAINLMQWTFSTWHGKSKIFDFF